MLRFASPGSKFSWVRISYLALLTLVIAGVVIDRSLRSEKRREAAARLEQDVRRVNELQAEAAKAEDPSEQLELRKQAKTALDSAAKNAMSPTDRSIMEVTQQLAARSAELNAAYLDAVSKFNESGGIVASSGLTSNQIDTRLDLLAKARDVHAKLCEHARTARESSREQLEARSVPKSNIDAYIRGMNRQGQYEHTVRLNECESQILESAEPVLRVLRKHVGNFTVDDSGSLLFADDVPEADVAFYNAGMAHMQSLIAEQAAVQEKLVRAMQK
jgi:hypothetical protein